MKKWGLGLILIGIGVFVLPLLGLQFKGLNKLDEGTRTILAIAAAGIGVVLFLLGRFSEKKTAKQGK